MRKRRVAFVNTHPIQYFAPMYKMLNQSDDLSITAIYLSDFSIRGAADRAFGRVVKWDVDLLDGYEAKFLNGASERSEPGGFMSIVAPSIWREVSRGRYDALVVHGHTPAANLIAASAAKASRTPVFMRGETHLGLARSRLKSRLRKPLMNALYSLLDGVLTIGSANVTFYRAMGVPAHRIFQMPYAIDNARFIAGAEMAVKEREQIRSQLGVEDDTPIVLYAAKFQRRKRPDDLLRAALRLSQMGVPFHVAMVGSGEMEEELRALAGQSGPRTISFHGFINQSQLPKIYAACDIFVLPSENEPWGLAVNEAMCAGLPIVASREIGCVPDLVQNDVNGRLFAAGDIDGLVQAMAPLLKAPSLRAQMGQSSRTIISRWGYEQCRDGLREALASVAERRSAP